MSVSRTRNGAITVRQASRLRGRVGLPGDKSITHRALLLSALAEGESRVIGGSDGLDCNSTAVCLAALGVEVAALGTATNGRVDRVVRSFGTEAFRDPAEPLDCGNSGTTLRLLAGALSGVPIRVVLDGDASLRRRPVARIIEPLRSMGAVLHARDDDSVPPLSVAGRRPLSPIDYATPIPSAQVKSAILLAGLAAEGATTVRETVATRDHTERMLRERGVTVRTDLAEDGASRATIEGPALVRSLDERVPGDISAAAFWLVAGAAHRDAELVVEQAGVNPTRRAVLDLLRRMGAEIEETPADSLAMTDSAEPMADLSVHSSRLRGVDISAEETARAIDEIPVLCVAAACAEGGTIVRGIGELRSKESDRVQAIAAGLRALGARVEVNGDDLVIEGGRARGEARALRGGEVASMGDHRVAMAFAIAGLVADGETTVEAARSADVSDPSFFSTLATVAQ